MIPKDILTTIGLCHSAIEVPIEFDRYFDSRVVQTYRRKNVLGYRDVGSIPAAGIRTVIMFVYRPGLYYEPFPRRLRLPGPTLPLEYVFIRIRSTDCGGAPESE